MSHAITWMLFCLSLEEHEPKRTTKLRNFSLSLSLSSQEQEKIDCSVEKERTHSLITFTELLEINTLSHWFVVWFSCLLCLESSFFLFFVWLAFYFRSFPRDSSCSCCWDERSKMLYLWLLANYSSSGSDSWSLLFFLFLSWSHDNTNKIQHTMSSIHFLTWEMRLHANNRSIPCLFPWFHFSSLFTTSFVRQRNKKEQETKQK